MRQFRVKESIMSKRICRDFGLQKSSTRIASLASFTLLPGLLAVAVVIPLLHEVAESSLSRRVGRGEDAV